MGAIMQLVDSHCHLDLLDIELGQVLSAANDAEVKYFLCVCVTLKDFPSMLSKILDFPNVWGSVGLHPNEKVDQEPTADELVLLANDKKIIAIGETGLDYFRTEGDFTFQQNRFREHIRAARACKKPLIIHTRQAKADTLRILREERADTVGGVMHCFTEDLEMAEAAMALGFYISFSGIVTFSNAKILQEVARVIPLERLLIETDSPWLAPIPHRGKPNYPQYVLHVAEFIAKLRNISVAEVAASTTQNFFNLFHPESL